MNPKAACLKRREEEKLRSVGETKFGISDYASPSSASSSSIYHRTDSPDGSSSALNF